MQSLLLSILLFSCLFVENTIALKKPEIVIHFNSTGMNYFKEVLFWLYTRETGDTYQTLLVNDVQSLRQSYYITSRPTKLVTHGWKSSGLEQSCQLIRHGLLYHGDYNVIVVDWSSYSKRIYPEAASRVKFIGQYVSQMIKFLVREGSNVKRMSLIGHSLGSHVMGLAGHEVSPKVAHIVGLDPAKPGFEHNTAEGRIHYTDADQVEIVHTNAGALGFGYSIGHADYWPNGGASQPGCGSLDKGVCSHTRSYEFYAEGLERPELWSAVQCESYALFEKAECSAGKVVSFPRWEPIPDLPGGNYMLRTRSSPLYGLGRNGTQP